MSQGAGRAKLRYHAETINLLGCEAILCPSALEKIEAAEQRLGKRLPASVRKWYSLQDAHQLLNDRVGYNPFCSVDQILAGFLEVPRKEPNWLEDLILVRASDESHALRLDGSDDPPVDVDPDEGVWEVCYPHFSRFVFGSAWEKKTRRFILPAGAGPRLYFYALDDEFSDIDLDYLKDNYDEGPHYPCHPEWSNLFFFSEHTWIWVGRITWQKKYSWRIVADSPQALEAVAKKLWPCGSLARTLTAQSPNCREILERVRAHFAS